MGFLITEEQRAAVEEQGVAGLPGNLTAILAANHARVLDFFRDADTNFDGCISKGEMKFALHKLGINASPREVDQLFDMLDPDGNGVLEFGELQQALLAARDGRLKGGSPKAKKPPTKAQLERLRIENRVACAEVNEMIFDFERQRGLNEPGAKPPPSAAVLAANDRIERLAAAAREARANPSFVVPRGELMSKPESILVKSALVRPQTAPARMSQAAASAQRKAATYDFWLTKHRGEIEEHARVVEKEYEDEKRARLHRRDTRREKQLSAYRSKAATSKQNALERLEPFPMRREVQVYRESAFSRQRERAWAQDIVFLPEKVAAREASLRRDRALPGYLNDVVTVRCLQHD
jgi:hypothetical protein